MKKIVIKENVQKLDFVYERISSIVLLFIFEYKRFKYYSNFNINNKIR